MPSPWYQDAFIAHSYPLGQCGAPPVNDFRTPPTPRLDQLRAWIDHLRWLGADAVYLGPVFESSSHGYDTADYRLVDRRLGTDGTLAGLTRALHDAGIRVILDGVFHHVGRDFWAFRDLQQNGEHSPFRDWFSGVDFSQRSPLGDPFSYDAWEGHFDLVKLNLGHPGVREHLFEAVRSWVDRFEIDGLRLDVAYALDPDFVRALADACHALRPEFWLLGEAIHGDYRRIAGPGLLDAVTNYECYKGLYSSHNDRNLFEIAHSLDRQFGDGGLYRDLTTYNFVDNHDVDRIASTLRDPAHLAPVHLLLVTMPGVPSIYLGSEWGIEGARSQGDDRPLRPPLPTPEAGRALGRHPDLAPFIARLAAIRRRLPALRHGSYHQLLIASEQFAFERRLDHDRAYIAINISSSPATLNLPVAAPDGDTFADQLAPESPCSVLNGHLTLDLPPHSGRILARP
ncbi:alpha-amylase family glycosyl hydrolase [Tautonia sp. JC769]|uniref:alpha-amylase family glycosyl hydrolase n=1 Tax=Tautonia sp. JC769 TaxID=3232135 RepID=UPI00345ABAE4